MVEIMDLVKKDAKEILVDMNNGKMGRPTDTPFQVANAAIELRIVYQLCHAILTSGEMLSHASNAIKECTDVSVKTLTKSIDEFRKSNDAASKALRNWTTLLVIATILLAIATFILALK